MSTRPTRALSFTVILFTDGHLLTENFPLKLIRAAVPEPVQSVIADPLASAEAKDVDDAGPLGPLG